MTVPSLRLVGVGFAHRPDVPLLAGVDLHLGPGFTAVVGPNGAGKTTLLRLLAGELAPTVGHRRGPAAWLCPQEVAALDESVRAFAWGWTGESCWALLSALGLDPADLDRWPTLSPGERKRWQIGAALAAEPEVLLLDEPTNHLDSDARERLLAALRGYRGIGVVVSHDRAVLRALASAVARVEDGAVTLFPGTWDAARDQWARDALAYDRRAEQADRAARATRRRLADARRAAGDAEAHVSASRRVKGPKDHDGRSLGAKFRAERAAGQLARRVGAERKRAERADGERLARRDALGAEVSFAATAGRSRVAALATAELRVGERVLLRDLDLWVDAGDKIWLRGPNGSGKSTLLAALLARARPEDVLHLPQELDGAEVLARLRATPPDERGRVLQAVAALGVSPEALLRTTSPSPGEARKLRIAQGLAAGVPLLALDEPTNHLDLPSVERLEAALRGFGGAVVVVTHDADLGAAVAATAWTLGSGGVRVGAP